MKTASVKSRSLPLWLGPLWLGPLWLGLGGMLAWATSASAADVAYGEHLSGECVTCHRKDGQEKGIPAIIGWPPDQFVAVLQSYKTKVRTHEVMRTIAGRMTDEDMAALAAYYATLKPPGK